MTSNNRPMIFGEVLFDCFPGGEQVLGGAPFNVAWHLQAFGDAPCFISRIGHDELGQHIETSMQGWGMDTTGLQHDAEHQTGRVDIELIDNEPHYTITPDCAYDFIDESQLPGSDNHALLYHGTLGLRNPVSRQALEALRSRTGISVFMDVNLRPPWWQQAEVEGWLQQARWVKLNQDELQQLGESGSDSHRDMADFQERYDLDLLIVTRGEEGAVVRERHGELHQVKPAPVKQFVDTVGAGDAFTAVFLHGLMARWPLQRTLEAAQTFASGVVGQRGATTDDASFYQAFDL